jgi:hypothetical protein
MVEELDTKPLEEKKPRKLRKATPENKALSEREEIAITEEAQEDGEELVFPGGPTKKQVDKWKEELAKKKLSAELVVVAVTGEDVPFIYRKLSRPEYMKIVGQARDNEDEDYREDVMDLCILWPKTFTREAREKWPLAGTPTTIFEHIMANSGFDVAGTFIL